MREKIIKNKTFILTDHALKRLSERRINDKLFELTILYGRKFYANGAEVYFLGKKELNRIKEKEIKLSDAYGINIIVQNVDEKKIVITAFKNKSLKQYKQH